MSYTAEVLADAPVGYWRMEETSGYTANDSSGFARHGTYSSLRNLNQTGIDAGRSVNFNGDAYVSVPDNAAFGPSAAITVECWVKGTSAWNSGSLVNRRVSATNEGGFTLEVGGTISFFVYPAGGTWVQASGSVLSLGAWHHIVGVFTSGRHEVWVDGALTVSLGTTGTLNNPAGASLEFGRNIGGPSLMLYGNLDEVAIYNTALSPLRIQTHYWAGAPYPTYAREVMADSPTGYWRLWEPSGTFCGGGSAGNTGGAGPDGTYIGGVTLNQPGAVRGGNASASFDGADDYVSIPHVAALDLTNDLTLEAWVYPTSRANYYMVVTKCTSNPSVNCTYEVELVVTTGVPYFIQVTSGGYQNVPASAAPPLNQWSHLVITKAGTAVTHYLNGAVNGTGTMSTGAMTSTEPLRIGMRADGYGFLGGMDEVAVYSYALSPTRVLAHYLTATSVYGSEVLSDAPQAFWRLGEASGTVAADSSGNSRTGTYAGTYTQNQTGAPIGETNTGALFANGYVQGPLLSAFNGSTGFTVEMWAKANGSWPGGAQLFCAGDSHDPYELVHCVLDNGYQMKLGFWFDDYTASFATLATGVWHHLVYVFEGPSTRYQRLYLNGVQGGTGRVSTATPVITTGATSGNGVQFARVDGASVNSILLDECAVYNYALSPARILAHYSAGVCLPSLWNAGTGAFQSTGAYPPTYWETLSGVFRFSGIEQSLWSTTAGAFRKV